MKLKEEKGIIFLYVIFFILVMLTFTIVIYYYVDSKYKLELEKNYEYQELYSKNYELISNIEYASDNEIIPIYNIDELDVAGTNNYIQIKKKIYQCGREKNYVLKDDIIVDIDEKIKNNLVSFNDYKLYSQTYHVDRVTYDILYYKNQANWKLVAYKKYENSNYKIENDFNADKTEFNILSNIEIVPSEEYEFLIMWTDNKKSEFYEEYNLQKFNSKKIKINDLEIFLNNVQNLNQDGEFYIFIKICNKTKIPE